jgi:opacity protein-like surface antigen
LHDFEKKLMHKRQVIFLIVLCFILCVGNVQAQIKGPKSRGGGFSSLARHKKYIEYIGGIGAANFLGEVGGADQIGTNFLKDLNFSATRPSLQLAYRFKFEKRWAVKAGFYYQRVTGADSLTTEIYRNNRNLSFRSNIFELSSQLEFYLTKGEQPGKRYKIRGAKGWTQSFVTIQVYTFMGVGAFYYNPKAKYNGKMVALQPLGTEGQGFPGQPDKYSRISVAIPFGLGLKQNITKNWTVGIEVAGRKTYTDYIDDVSNTYYDNERIRKERGNTAADLADPKLYKIPGEVIGYKVDYKGGDQGGAGQQRGDVRDRDAYMFVNITVGYKVPIRKSFRRKSSRHF